MAAPPPPSPLPPPATADHSRTPSPSSSTLSEQTIAAEQDGETCDFDAEHAHASTLSGLGDNALKDLLAPISVSPSHSRPLYFANWARTFACHPAAIFDPSTEDECALILEAARREGKRIRVVGVGHSPSDIACTQEWMVRTERINRVLEIDTAKRPPTVLAQAGITLTALHEALAERGLAMVNVGSISEQTLAGIITTASHGSGMKYGVMSTNVRSLHLLLASGERVTCNREQHQDLFCASLCGLGATGMILRVELEVESAFRLREVQRNVRFEEAVERLDEFSSASEHSRLWWFPSAQTIRVSLSNRTTEPKRPVFSWLWHSLMGFHVVQLLLFIALFVRDLNPWIQRFACWLVSEDTVGIDDGWRVFNVECRYAQYTTEWAIPYTQAQPCLRALDAYLSAEERKPGGVRAHFPIEIRFSAPDDIWLSPSRGEQTCWIGIVQYKPYGHPAPYRRLFTAFEHILAAHGGRPHWAKAHALAPPRLRELYPKFDDFVRVCEEVDPQGVWRNEYVRRHIFGQDIEGGARVYKEFKQGRVPVEVETR